MIDTVLPLRAFLFLSRMSFQQRTPLSSGASRSKSNLPIRHPHPLPHSLFSLTANFYVSGSIPSWSPWHLVLQCHTMSLIVRFIPAPSSLSPVNWVWWGFLFPISQRTPLRVGLCYNLDESLHDAGCVGVWVPLIPWSSQFNPQNWILWVVFYESECCFCCFFSLGKGLNVKNGVSTSMKSFAPSGTLLRFRIDLT